MITPRLVPLLLRTCAAAFVVACWFASNGLGAQSGTTTVPVTVLAAVELDISGCPGGTVSFGTILRGSTNVTPFDCTIQFGSPNAPGTTLYATDESDAWAMQSGTDTIPDVAPGGGPLSSGFGHCVRSASWPATVPSGTSPCDTWDFVWYPLRQSSPRTIATVPVPGMGSVGIRFGVVTAQSTPPGTYTGAITFTVIA